MKLKQFFYNLTSIDSFLKEFDRITKSNNDVEIESFLNEEKTHYFIEKIKHTSHHYHGLYFTLQNFIHKAKPNLIKKAIDAGLDINYQSVPLFSAIFEAPDKSQIDKVGQVFLDCGFDINQLTLHPKNALAPIHYVLKELSYLDLRHKKMYYTGININGKRRKPFYNEEDDKSLTKISPSYKLLHLLIKKGIDLHQPRQANVITFALDTRSKIVIKDMLSLKGITWEYIQTGLAESKEKNIFSNEVDELIEKHCIHLEKKQLEEKFSMPQNQPTKKHKI